MVEFEKIVDLVRAVETEMTKSQGGCDQTRELLVGERIFVRASNRRVHQWFLVRKIVIIAVEQLVLDR